MKAKKSTGKYSRLSSDVVAHIFKMISSGPIPTLTLRAYLQEHVYPDTMKITSVMVMNIKAQVLRLHRKYGGVSPSVSMKDMRSVFHKRSLEYAPQDWYTDPIYAKVFKQSMTEVLSTDDRGGAFPIVQVMNKIKLAQSTGYEYDVFLSRSGQPVGLMQMVPSQKEAHLRFGDIIAIDSQDKTKTPMDGSACFLLGGTGTTDLSATVMQSPLSLTTGGCPGSSKQCASSPAVRSSQSRSFHATWGQVQTTSKTMFQVIFLPSLMLQF